jgi:prepilin-type N-terminal cleavage/methylation domain-containing protein
MLLRYTRWRAQKAFTLVEAMVALFVIALISAVFPPLFIQADRAVKTAHHREIATQAAHQALEGWRQMGYALLPVIPAGQTVVAATFAPPTGLPGATGTVTITRVDTSFVPATVETGRREVVTSVTWAGTGSDLGAVTQTTLLVNES